MPPTPNYSEYSLKELREARAHIDELAYPERVELIEKYITQKETESQILKEEHHPVTESPNKMSLVNKTLIAFCVVFILAGILYASMNVFEKGKRYTDPYIKLAKENGIACSFYAARVSTAEGKSMVQVSCEATDELISQIEETVFDNQQDFKELVNQYIVTPNLAATPKDDMQLVVITLIDHETVLCTATHKGKITNSRFDSYNGYCGE